MFLKLLLCWILTGVSTAAWTGSFWESCDTDNSPTCRNNLDASVLSCSCSPPNGAYIQSVCYQSCCPLQEVNNNDGVLECVSGNCTNVDGQACTPTVAPTLTPTTWPTELPPTELPTPSPSTLTPTTSPTKLPTPSPSRFPTNTLRPTPSEVLASYRIPLQAGVNEPVANIHQLALGYNNLLGLLPWEQQGSYMRNPIFKFHLNNESVFLVMQGQNGAYVEFDQPLEYYVTAEDGRCDLTSSSSDTTTLSQISSFDSESSSWGIGTQKVNVNAATAKTVAELAVRRLYEGKTTGSQSKASFAVGGQIFGNSQSAENSYSAIQKGFSKQTKNTLKRTYYTAGLRVDRLVRESFTLDFRMAAQELVSQEYDFTSTVQFIHLFGNFVFDSVNMGARMSQNYYFTEDISNNDAKAVTNNAKTSDFSVGITEDVNGGSNTQSTSVNGNTVTYQSSTIEKLGEFSTLNPASSINLSADECRIGFSIIPQPLWNPDIPLETFLDTSSAIRFRNYLQNATESMVNQTYYCLNDQGLDCTTSGGTCVPDLSNSTNGVFESRCVPTTPTSQAGIANATYQFAVYMSIQSWFLNGNARGLPAGVSNANTYLQASLYEWKYPNQDHIGQVKIGQNLEGLNPSIITPPALNTSYRIALQLNSAGNGNSYELTPGTDSGGANYYAFEVFICPLIQSADIGTLSSANSTCTRIFNYNPGSSCTWKTPVSGSATMLAIGFSLMNSSPNIGNVYAVPQNVVCPYLPWSTSCNLPSQYVSNTQESYIEVAAAFNTNYYNF